MEHVEKLAALVADQQLLVEDAERIHLRLRNKYARLDAERAMVDQQVAAAAEDIEKAKSDLEALKAQVAQESEGDS